MLDDSQLYEPSVSGDVTIKYDKVVVWLSLEKLEFKYSFTRSSENKSNLKNAYYY